MIISDLELFVNVCKIGFKEACSAERIGENHALEILNNLGEYLGFRLFVQNEIPAVENLTDSGRAFLPSAINISNEIINGIFNVCKKMDKQKRLVLRSTFGYGKIILLPSIYRSLSTNILRQIKLDVITYKHVPEIDIAETHILFHKMSALDEIFFEKRWSVRLKQGLYASEEYLIDVGSVPKRAEDLKNHSIISFGDCFDLEVYKTSNWHLSGQYGLCELEPSIFINSNSVLMAAVAANLGVGPVVECHEQFGYRKLYRVLPEVQGPEVVIDFAVRRNLSGELWEYSETVSGCVKAELEDKGIEILYGE